MELTTLPRTVHFGDRSFVGRMDEVDALRSAALGGGDP